MRPYSGKNLPQAESVYNYELSRARRIIENNLGILASRWRIFHHTIITIPEHIVTYTKAAIALHNILRTTESSTYCPPGSLDTEDSNGDIVRGCWRDESAPQGMEPLRSVGSNRHSSTAATVRTIFRDYFSSPAGELSWQCQHVSRTN